MVKKIRLRKTKEETGQSIKQNTKTTVADSAAHHAGQDNTIVLNYPQQQYPQNSDTVKGEDTTKRYAFELKKYSTSKGKRHQQKKRTGITTKSKR